MRDFFISYNRHDKQWAEWLAWTLEEAGYTVVIQAWDFRPGGNFALDMQRASVECEKTIAVLSEHYLKSEYTQSEWSAAFADDPQSLKRKLILMRVGECRPEGVLKTIVYVDLVGVAEPAIAKKLVLDALKARAKPDQEPTYPGAVPTRERTEPEPVAFPGEGQTAEPAAGSGLKLEPFDFTVVTVNAKGEQVKAAKKTAHSFQEDLGDGVGLEVVSIPGGKFFMGSPETEGESFDYERPQHLVRVEPFFIGKYLVTQEQWFTVAEWPKVNHDLDPNCSKFKGLKHPVEYVNWREAVEFCDRLSRKTGRQYRLPSEVEWEYACRAGTTTPFHFGKTLTTDLANYDGTETYGAGPKGSYRAQTTDVGSFPPNAFGLYDMSGNVWEWCSDQWHDNYQGAPTDGSAWVTGGDSEKRMRRGGSWLNAPLYCRSAYRVWSGADQWFSDFGFRVVCSA